MRLRVRYGLLGVLLGLGAPVGSLAWRSVTRFQGEFLTTLVLEYQSAHYYYLYMTLGTVVAFGIFGYVLGMRNDDLRDLSITDGLTHLFNHRYIQDQLIQEIERSKRYETPVTCLMLDIDDFKAVNDRYGHPFGDTVLATTARLIRKAVRKIDIVARYGGEEFLVLMPQTTGEDAQPLAERILKAVHDHLFSIAEEAVHISLSIGLATFPSPQQGVKTNTGLLSAADQALYSAKRAGKNRMVVWHS